MAEIEVVIAGKRNVTLPAADNDGAFLANGFDERALQLVLFEVSELLAGVVFER
jgi:hypothetical protein